MSFDSLALHLVAHECRNTLLGSTIRHIEQLGPQEICIKTSQGAQTHHLLISAHPIYARAHLIKEAPKGQAWSYFADFLMKHLLRGQVTSIAQSGWDRILKLTVMPKAEELEASPKSIVAEFMGKHSNIILVDEETSRILESIKHIDETMSRFREVLPGLPYTPPPRQDKRQPLELTQTEFNQLLEGQKIGWRALFDAIDGLSPTLAKEILFRAGDNPTPDALWCAYREVIAHFQVDKSHPQALWEHADGPGAGQRETKRTRVVAVSALPLQQYANTTSRHYPTMSEALTAYYDAVILEAREQAERNALSQVLDKTKTAIERKLTQLKQDLANAVQSEEYRIKGELLTANLHRVAPGQGTIDVQNYYSPDLAALTIELDPTLSPSDNAQHYFRQYQKAKRGRSVLHQLIADNEAELEVLDYYGLEVDEAQGLEALLAIRAELVKKGWIRESKKATKQTQSAGAFRKYMSPDGFQIYVGRSSTENDLLLRRIASKNDMWLHAKQIHGSHVIVRNPENKPGIPMPTLLQAAQIAAAFSKAKHSSYVPVDYTWAKHVMKPKKSAAGFVHYTHEKTLYVEPMLPKAEDAETE